MEIFLFLSWIKNNYDGVETIITENGWSDDGSSLIDDARITYLRVYKFSKFPILSYFKFNNILGSL